MNAYKTLSSAYDKAYQAHLEAFQRRLANTYSAQERYTEFYPSIGVRTNEEVDVLVYGQAVGGWHPELDYGKPIPSDRGEESKRYSNEPYPGHSPLDWVNVLWTNGTFNKRPPEEQAHYEGREKGYRAWSSFFWQTTIALMQHRNRITDDEDWNWHNGLVWSNLYKIAPQDYSIPDAKEKYNPTETDRALQRPDAVDLVRMELDELRPKLCVVLTNDSWWAPFRKGLPTKPRSTRLGENLECVEQYNDTRIVVVKRLRGMSYKKAVADIIAVSS